MSATDERALLKLARDGDEGAFGELVEAHRAQLRAHSVPDARLGARRRGRSAGGAAARVARAGRVRGPQFRALVAVLDRHQRRPGHHQAPVAAGAARRLRPGRRASRPSGSGRDRPGLAGALPGPVADRAGDAGSSPEAVYEQRESMELAFIVALQKLPPLQRAALLLREVVGFSTTETADQLGASVASVNSALQRARAAVRGGLPDSSQQETLRALGDQRTRAIVEKYMDAMERGDADALVGMLTEDATWCMPPIPTWFAGHDLLREFLLRYPLSERWKHLPTQANGQLAVGLLPVRLFGRRRLRPAWSRPGVLTSAREKSPADQLIDRDHEGRCPAGQRREVLPLRPATALTHGPRAGPDLVARRGRACGPDRGRTDMVARCRPGEAGPRGAPGAPRRGNRSDSAGPRCWRWGPWAWRRSSLPSTSPRSAWRCPAWNATCTPRSQPCSG